MDEQTFSYHSNYYPTGNFIPHNLGQSKTFFTGLPLEIKEQEDSSLKIPNFPFPAEYREQRRSRFFDRLIETLKESDLPGSDLAITYLTHQFHRNCKEATLASCGASISFFLTFLKTSGKVRVCQSSDAL